MEVVTQELLDRARLLGPCSHELPRVGDKFEDLTFVQLLWVDERQMLSAPERREIVGRDDIPMALVATNGYGDGNGDGYGNNNGDGYGYKDGDGYGYGYGYGYGTGSGNGDGEGDGYGCGSGSGSGSG